MRSLGWLLVWCVCCLLVTGAVGEVVEVVQRDLPCALQWSGWTGDTVGDLCGSLRELETVEELIPCGRKDIESRILFVGDSLVRDLFVSFLELLDVPLSWKWDDYKGHRSFDVLVREGVRRNAVTSFSPFIAPVDEREPMHWREPEVEEAIIELPGPPCGGITISFRWAPFVRNVTRVFGREEIRGTALILDSGLWDLLHIHKEETLTRDLREFSGLLGNMWGGSRTVIWITPGRMQTSLMLTEEKKSYLTDNAVDGLNRVIAEAFSVSPVRLRRVDLRHTMDFAESIESQYQLTTDGIHPPQQLLRSIIPTILSHWLEEREGRRLESPIRLQAIDRERPTVPLATGPPPPTKPQGFIGSDPYLGGLVGLYFLLTFLTGDILIVSRPLLWILET